MSTINFNDPFYKPFRFDLIELKKRPNTSDFRLTKVPLNAFLKKTAGGFSGSYYPRGSKTHSFRLYGEIQFNIKNKVLQVIKLSSEHGEVTHKLMIIAYEFFKFYSCKDIQVIAKPENVISFLLHGFLPEVDEFRAAAHPRDACAFNKHYAYGKQFTPEEYEAIDGKYKGALAQKLGLNVSEITYEIFLKNWPWDCSTCGNTYSIKKLTRTIFQSNDAEKRKNAEEFLRTQVEIPMTLPTHAVGIYKKEAAHFSESSFYSKMKLNSVWLPKLPEERIVNLSKDPSIPFICEVKGPFYKKGIYLYKILQGSTRVGKVTFSIGEQSIHVRTIKSYTSSRVERRLTLQALLDIVSRAAFTNSHCEGRADMTLKQKSDLSTALEDFGYIKDLSGTLQRMSVSDRATDINPISFKLNPKTAIRWGKQFYAKRLQEELTLMIMGKHPYSSSDSLENLTHSDDTLCSLLIHLTYFDMLMPSCERNEGSFKDRVMEYFNLHATLLLKKGKLRYNPPSTDIIPSKSILLSKFPLVLLAAIYKVLCEDSKTLINASILEKSPNFNNIFREIQGASFAYMASRSVLAPPAPDLNAASTDRKATVWFHPQVFCVDTNGKRSTRTEFTTLPPIRNF